MNQQEALNAIKDLIDNTAKQIMIKVEQSRKSQDSNPKNVTLPLKTMTDIAEISFLVKREIEAPSEQYPTAKIAPNIEFLLRTIALKTQRSKANEDVKQPILTLVDAIGAHLSTLSNNSIHYSSVECRRPITEPVVIVDPRLLVVQSLTLRVSVQGSGVSATVQTGKLHSSLYNSEAKDAYIQAVKVEIERLTLCHLSSEQREKRTQNKNEGLVRTLGGLLSLLEEMQGDAPRRGGMSEAGQPDVDLGALLGGAPRRGGMSEAGQPNVDLGALLGGAPRRGGMPGGSLFSMMAMRAALNNDSDNDNDSDSDNDSDNRRSASPSS